MVHVGERKGSDQIRHVGGVSAIIENVNVTAGKNGISLGFLKCYSGFDFGHVNRFSDVCC
jgi:hypothetical protein